jgi:hypothetical protein
MPQDMELVMLLSSKLRSDLIVLPGSDNRKDEALAERETETTLALHAGFDNELRKTEVAERETETTLALHRPSLRSLQSQKSRHSIRGSGQILY